MTRRTAPPHHINLVHIDYPENFGLSDLWQEWLSRWCPLQSQLELPDDNDNHEGASSSSSSLFVRNHRLCGVLTVWVLLSASDAPCPLWVVDTCTVTKDMVAVYKVGGGRALIGRGVPFSPYSLVWCPGHEAIQCLDL